MYAPTVHLIKMDIKASKIEYEVHGISRIAVTGNPNFRCEY